MAIVGEAYAKHHGKLQKTIVRQKHKYLILRRYFHSCKK